MTGEVLGSHGQPIPVQATMNVPTEPTFLQKIGLKKQQPLTQTVTVWVCCPECVAEVKKNPAPYIATVVVARGGAMR